MLVSPFLYQGVLLLSLTLSTANVNNHQETERERTFMLVIREENPGTKRKREVNWQRKAPSAASFLLRVSLPATWRECKWEAP
jgi:hypothetical protein